MLTPDLAAETPRRRLHMIRRPWWVLGVLAAAAFATPVALDVVDWGMDGNLTPDAWHVGDWLKGAFLCALVVGTYACPLAIVGVIIGTIVMALSPDAGQVRCPECGLPVRAASTDCRRCGRLPPRRPIGADLLARCAWGFTRIYPWVGRVLTFLLPVLLLSTFAAWVILELEEDGFGQRARAAAAAGADEYFEDGVAGAYLRWGRSDGYGAHRD